MGCWAYIIQQKRKLPNKKGGLGSERLCFNNAPSLDFGFRIACRITSLLGRRAYPSSTGRSFGKEQEKSIPFPNSMLRAPPHACGLLCWPIMRCAPHPRGAPPGASGPRFSCRFPLFSAVPLVLPRNLERPFRFLVPPPPPLIFLEVQLSKTAKPLCPNPPLGPLSLSPLLLFGSRSPLCFVAPAQPAVALVRVPNSGLQPKLETGTIPHKHQQLEGPVPSPSAP